MADKFNFYDFVGYIIPGAATLVLIYWLNVGLFGQTLPLAIDSLGESIIFLAAAYFVGQLVQAVGQAITKPLRVKAFEVQYSEQFLCAGDPHMTDAFRTDLARAITRVFGLALDPSNLTQTRERREAFNLCYALIVQEGANAHTELFGGIFGLLRGMFAVACLAIPIAIAIVLRNVVAGIRLEIGIGIAVLVAALLSLKLLLDRADSFSKQFAVSVFQNFYVWYSAKQLDQAKADSES